MSRGVLERPPRPSIPLALWAFCLTIGCERLVLEAGRSLGLGVLRCLLTICCGFASIGAVCMMHRLLWRRWELGNGTKDAAEARARDGAYGDQTCARGRNAQAQYRSLLRTAWQVSLPLATCICAGVAVTACACVLQTRALRALESSAVSAWQLTIASDGTPSDYGWHYQVRVTTSAGLATSVSLSTKESFERGQVVRCVGRFRPLSDDEYGRSAWLRGMVGSVRVVHVMGTQPPQGFGCLPLALRAQMLDTIGPQSSDVRALLAGVVCGYRRGLDECGLTEAFSACGIAHLIAVSGTHLAVVGLLVARLLSCLQLRLSGRLALLVIITGGFVIMCGAPPSAVRAWLMSVSAAGAQMVGRRAHGISAVSVVALVMVLIDPYLCGNLGFALSVVSVVSLCLCARYASYALTTLLRPPALPRWVPRRLRRRIYALCDEGCGLLAATLVCQLATMPLAVESFGTLSLVAPLTNVMLSPLLSVVLAVGLVVLGLQGVPPLCQGVLAAYDYAAAPLVHAVRHVARWPFASVALTVDPSLLAAVILAGAAALLVWWPNVSRKPLMRVVMCLVVAVSLWAVRWRYFAPARIVVFDVGQGDAILVQDGAQAILVDTGPPGVVAAALARNHVMHLDAVVITHLHDDHMGGLADVAQAVPCERVIVAEGVTPQMDEGLVTTSEEMTGSVPYEMSYGDRMVVGSYTLRMVWPRVPVLGTTNPDSIELLVHYVWGGRTLTALLTGDAEELETGACVATGDVGRIDLLKVGHHGSEVSLDAVTARVLSPCVAVASAGEGNSYGHPRHECIEVLESVGARFLCTKDVGDVEVRPGRAGPLVRCQK